MATSVLVLWSIGSTQNPTKAPYGSTITLVPSLGHAPVTVPNIPTSYSFAQAQAALQAVGLTAHAEQRVQHDRAVGTGHLDLARQRGAGALRLGRDGQRLDRPADGAGPQRHRGHGEPRPPPRCRRQGLSVSGVSGSPNNNVVGTQPSVGSTVNTGSSVQLFTH